MLDRLQYVKQRFDEISDLIIQPDVIADQKRYVQLNKEYKDLKELVEKRDEYINLVGNINEAKEIIADGSDAEMVEMAKMQLDEANERLPQLEEEIKFMLIPIQKMRKTLWWKSVRVLEEMRLLSLRVICIVCTRNIANQKAGELL